AADIDDLMTTNNSDRLIASVNTNLDALNFALDRLEQRTEQVLQELNLLIDTENGDPRRVQPTHYISPNAHDGCGDYNFRR
ncbi:hypothetical protein KR018_002073, partial [Drosophila ironensis]